MRTLLKILSFIGLVLTLIPSMLVLTGDLSMQQNKTLMIAGTALWFITVPFWMNRKAVNKKRPTG